MTAAWSAWRTNRPRSVPGGCSRTPWASMRGSSSSRRSIASCRSSGSSDSASVDVVLDRPAFGVLAVEGLVQRDAEAAQHRPPLEPAGEDLLAGAEQGVGVEVDGAGVDLDVPGV